MSGRVAITPHGLRIDGRTRLLYGGEVQYFRLRDRRGDPRRTQRLWAETLDLLVAADMNLVTVYVPWDYHERAPGAFDFSGERDLASFLELCHARDLAVVFKPGPFINSEWPYGIGSFGAVPDWFRARHPEALALGPDGRPFSVDLLQRERGAQPSYFAPALHAATERWFARLAPLVRRYVFERPTIFGIQLDNETNFYFSDHYAVDYSPPALAEYRAFLRARYGSIEALNAAYGTTHGRFERVEPPRRPPRPGDAPARDVWHRDWFAAAQAGIAAYQLRLRRMWEALGIAEPDVVFLTNDSPHTMPKELGREHLLLWDGQAKNTAGLAMLDAYPRQLPGTRGPHDLPFLTAFFSTRFAAANDRYVFAGEAPVAAGKCYGAELEGGLFELPLLERPLPVPASATDHVLLQHIGRGSAAAAVYVFRGGRNLDGSPYFSGAAVGIDGRRGARYAVLQRWGRLVREHGEALLRSEPVSAGVALVVDGGAEAPAAGATEHPGRVQVDQGTAAFAMWLDAGFDLPVFDLREAEPGQLARFPLVVFLNPGWLPTASGELLDDYVEAGGWLLNLLHRGPLAEGMLAGGDPRGLQRTRKLLHWTLSGARVALAPGGGPVAAGPFVERYALSGDAEPLAWAWRRGGGGAPVGWSAPWGQGRALHLGTNPAARYATARYYAAPADELLRGRAFARELAAAAGAPGPVVSVAGAAGVAWARRVPGDGVFVFVGSRLRRAATLRVDLHDIAALGISPELGYRVTEGLSGRSLGAFRGADLARRGLAVELGPFGTAALRLR